MEASLPWQGKIYISLWRQVLDGKFSSFDFRSAYFDISKIVLENMDESLKVSAQTEIV